MIPPLKAIAGTTTMSNPIALNPQRAYKDTMNYSFKGEKLNIDCTERRTLVNSNGQNRKIDYYA